MGSSLLLALAQLCTFSGMCWFALAKTPHWKQVLESKLLTRHTSKILRVLGTTALLFSLWLCLRADHASMAVLVWIMLLAPAALAVAFTLTWRPRLLKPWVLWIRS